jgi:hypothetical protein
VNCNELNQVQSKKAPEDATRSLKDVYQRPQSAGSAGNLPGRVASFRNKKTLVDKNIDLLEKVEAMEKETLELKNEYLEMTHQLSVHEANPPANVDNDQLKQIKTEIEKVSAMGGKLSGLEDIKEILLSIQTEPAREVDFSDIKSFIQKELKSDLEKLANNSDHKIGLLEIKDALSKILLSPSKAADFTDIKDFIQKEIKSSQHVMNTIAGEVRVLRKELEDISRKINSGQLSHSQAQPSQSMPTVSSNIAPEKTTEFIPVPGSSEDPAGDLKSSSVGKKGSKSFKAVSDRLKSLKL